MKQPTEPGIYNMDWAQYRALDALNNSALDKLAQSPLHFKTYLEQPQQPPTTPMQIGSAFHFCVLQPDRFKAEIVADPGWNKNSNKYKEWATTKQGKIVLKRKDINNVLNMARVLRSKRSAMQYLSSGWAEKAIVWQDPETGIWCKGLVDWLCPDMTVVDLKKTVVATQWAFGGSIRRYNYYRQAAFYARGFAALGMKMKDFVWIASESDPPNEARAFIADPYEIDEADAAISPLLYRLAECQKTDEWPGYPDEAVEFGYRYDPATSVADGINF